MDLAVFLQVLDDLFDRLLAGRGDLGDVPEKGVVRDGDVLGGGDLLQQEIGAEIGGGAPGGETEDLFLLADHVLVGRALLAAFLDQGVGLVLGLALDDRVREFEIDGLVEVLDDLADFEVVDLLFLFSGHVGAEQVFQVLEGFSGDQFLGEIVVEFGELGGFDAFEGGVEGDFLAVEFLEGEGVVQGDGDVLGVALVHAGKLHRIAGEKGAGFDGEPMILTFGEVAAFFADDLDEGFAIDGGGKIHDRDILILKRAVGDVLEFGEALAEAL